MAEFLFLIIMKLGNFLISIKYFRFDILTIIKDYCY